MASSVFYKFKSQRVESRVTFDGTGISVFDLKKDIILANNLGKANDFDLVVFDSSSGEEFRDDSHIIPRSSSVVVKRVPPTRPGKGKAAMYIAAPGTSATSESKPNGPAGTTSWSNKGSLSRRFDKEATSKSVPAPLQTFTGKDGEAAAMAAMFQAQSANWEETQEKMSQLVSSLAVLPCLTRVYTSQRGTGFVRGGKPFAPHHQSERPLPPSYVCYRCGQKGHWIQDCPTNNDREFDNKPRIKRTTGIPRSFLKAVDNPSGARIGQGVMVTPEGGYVVAQPDLAAWQRQTTKPKALSETEVRERPSRDPSIVCLIDNRIFRDAVKTPCCGAPYCEDCIQTHLLEKDFICPNCGSKVASLDKLAIDKPMRTKVIDYICREIEASQKEEDTSQTPAPDDLQSGLYAQEEVPADLAMSQMIVDNIPQLQAQIQQISLMLQNSSNLPAHVRQQTEMQHQQLQMQLAQAQTIAAALVAAQSGIGAEMMMPMGMMPMMNQGFAGPQMQMPPLQQQQQQQQHQQHQQHQQPGNADSAYQRQPVNNRRRNIKRERPSDFLEVAGPDAERDNKVARYWE
ncbi:DWNN-domain-containing protein [Multifurca ochricompacta]|uniref:DWNN-domain-containing protein n=1 Tax=Multifurca ochricompacta TaxID=376703 RepID=A0AAD4MAZ5_9AGAM|nr:DWNN-domain-containing protein [Multifurca ochricompacta]